MGKIADSIQENLEHINAALNDVEGVEFDADIYISTAEANTSRLSDEAEQQTIINELKNNPDVDDGECVPLFEADAGMHKSAGAPSEAEQEAAQKAEEENMKAYMAENPPEADAEE